MESLIIGNLEIIYGNFGPANWNLAMELADKKGCDLPSKMHLDIFHMLCKYKLGNFLDNTAYWTSDGIPSLDTAKVFLYRPGRGMILSTEDTAWKYHIKLVRRIYD